MQTLYFISAKIEHICPHVDYLFSGCGLLTRLIMFTKVESARCAVNFHFVTEENSWSTNTNWDQCGFLFIYRFNMPLQQRQPWLREFCLCYLISQEQLDCIPRSSNSPVNRCMSTYSTVKPLVLKLCVLIKHARNNVYVRASTLKWPDCTR